MPLHRWYGLELEKHARGEFIGLPLVKTMDEHIDYSISVPVYCPNCRDVEITRIGQGESVFVIECDCGYEGDPLIEDPRVSVEQGFFCGHEDMEKGMEKCPHCGQYT